jgi:hypothetical protein
MPSEIRSTFFRGESERWWKFERKKKIGQRLGGVLGSKPYSGDFAMREHPEISRGTLPALGRIGLWLKLSKASDLVADMDQEEVINRLKVAVDLLNVEMIVRQSLNDVVIQLKMLPPHHR